MKCVAIQLSRAKYLFVFSKPATVLFGQDTKGSNSLIESSVSYPFSVSSSESF